MLSLSMVFDGELQRTLSDRETSLDGNNGSWDLVAIPYTRKLRALDLRIEGRFRHGPSHSSKVSRLLID